jgi:hypothetical protein
MTLPLFRRICVLVMSVVGLSLASETAFAEQGWPLLQNYGRPVYSNRVPYREHARFRSWRATTFGSISPRQCKPSADSPRSSILEGRVIRSGFSGPTEITAAFWCQSLGRKPHRSKSW